MGEVKDDTTTTLNLVTCTIIVDTTVNIKHNISVTGCYFV